MLRCAVQFAGALATVLDVVRAAVGPGCAVELLRKESLAGLQPAAAAKVRCAPRGAWQDSVSCTTNIGCCLTPAAPASVLAESNAE